MREALASAPAIDDGVRFDVEALKVSRLREGGVPGGAVTTTVQIGKAVVNFKCDAGFYDASQKADLELVDFPSILPKHISPIRIYRQPIEHAIADKIHASVKHGAVNTRLRDLYDLYVFCTRCEVDEYKLQAWFGKWQKLYGTTVPSGFDHVAQFGRRFIEANDRDWNDMRRDAGWRVPVPDLAETMSTIRIAYEPAMALAAAENLRRPS